MKTKPQIYFVFDVESIGLHGEGFSVGFFVTKIRNTRVFFNSFKRFHIVSLLGVVVSIALGKFQLVRLHAGQTFGILSRRNIHE